MFTSQKNLKQKIAIIGIGSAGCSIVSSLKPDIRALVRIHYCHTQADYLVQHQLHIAISIETENTKLYGADGEVKKGLNCAAHHREKIIAELVDYSLVFLVAGLGGGTGSGALPYISNLLKNENILCVALVTLPFKFEGNKKERIALAALNRVKNVADAVIPINNELIKNQNKKINYRDLFSTSETLISASIYGLIAAIKKPGMIDTDFDDLRQAIKNSGNSSIAKGYSRRKHGLRHATINCIFSSLNNLDKAQNYFVTMTTNGNASMNDFLAVWLEMKDLDVKSSDMVFSHIIDPQLSDRAEVIIIALGVKEEEPLKRSRMPNRIYCGWIPASLTKGKPHK